MTARYPLRRMRASVKRDERGNATGEVSLWGIAAWLKREPVTSADLTPGEARKLATQLLVAADRAEDAL